MRLIAPLPPCSATVMSETATTKTRGTYVAAVFACQVPPVDIPNP
jgi:hypothetical protein